VLKINLDKFIFLSSLLIVFGKNCAMWLASAYMVEEVKNPLPLSENFLF